MSEDNPLPDFWLRVAESHLASEDVDNFDPDGTEQSNVRLYEMVGVCNEAAINLIEYVVEHKDELLENLKGAA